MAKPVNPGIQLKKGYLQKESTWLNLRDNMILLSNIYRANQDGEIGFEHAVKTMEELIRPMENRRIMLPLADIESALWSCQLLDEKGKFWHPTGKKFDEFLKDISNLRFNKFFCWFEKYGKGQSDGSIH